MGFANQVTEAELRAIGMPDAGIQYVLNVCQSPPARKVGARRRRNLVLDVPMGHLGVVLQAESLSGEYLFLLGLDRRADLCAVYDQPLSIPLSIVDSSGRRTRINYTADYLVVEPGAVQIYEIKPDVELEDLCKQRPSDWSHDDHGYHYLPAIAYFANFGIQHITVHSSSLSCIRSDNLRLLASARQSQDTKRLHKMRDMICRMVREEGAIKAGEILDRLEEVDATALLQLIDSEVVFAALDSILLSDVREVWIASSLHIANTLQETDQQLAPLLRSSSILESGELINPRYHAEIATRWAAVQNPSSLGSGKELRSERTKRRYRSALKESGGDPLSLQPSWSSCGNRGSRMSEIHRSFICQTIHEGRSDSRYSSIHRRYQNYLNDFDGFKEQTGLLSEKPIGRATYYRLWKQVANTAEDAYYQGGRRLRNAQSDAFDPPTKTVIATRPFAVAHVDHWKADLFVVVGHIQGKKITARPWLTAMVDAYSGEVLAISLSFADPSRRSCSMVIRDCVRRHGRLPEIIITDGGSDFRSTHFALMLATFGVTRCERSPEDPRFGQEVERLFGHFKERFARGLPGFGLSIAQARSVSGAMKAHKAAKLSLTDAYFALEAYTFNGYNQSPKPGSLDSRAEISGRALQAMPFSGRAVEWNLKFLVATSVDPPNGQYTLWRGRGVHVLDQWYTSPHLLSYQGYKKDISVRIEPYDMATIYVCVDGRWIVCRSSKTNFHAALTDRRCIDSSIAFHDLRIVRKAIASEMDREASRIVAEKLEEISRRGVKSGKVPKTQTIDESEEGEVGSNFGLFFDDIQPLDESNES